jgi:DNA-binding NarL/FixJ family response regulator
MKKPRVLVADDHPVMLKALCGLLEDGLGEIVGAVTDGQALVEAAQRLEPDIILADISMPKLNGLEATRALQETVPQSKIIILTSHCEPAYVTLAFELGARGFLLKRSSLQVELSQALLHVLAGDRYIGLGVREERAFADEGEYLIRYRLCRGWVA